jgi:hypothetical protein
MQTIRMTFHTVLRLNWCLFVGLRTSCCDSVLMALWSLVSVCTARALRSLYALDFVDDRRRRLSRFNRYVCIKVSWQSFCDSDRLFIPYAALPRSPSLTLTHPHSPSLTLGSPSAHPRLTHAHPRRMIMKAHPTPLLRNIAGHHG